MGKVEASGLAESFSLGLKTAKLPSHLGAGKETRLELEWRAGLGR